MKKRLCQYSRKRCKTRSETVVRAAMILNAVRCSGVRGRARKELILIRSRIFSWIPNKVMQQQNDNKAAV